MPVKPIDQFPLIPKPELVSRLKKYKGKAGDRPCDGEGISINVIAMFLAVDRKQLFNALSGYLSNPLQLKLSHFFARYDNGEMTFHFQRGMGWSWIFNNPPIPRAKPKTVLAVRIREGGGVGLGWERKDLL